MNDTNLLDTIEEEIGNLTFSLDNLDVDTTSKEQDEVILAYEDAVSSLIDTYRDLMAAFGRKPQW